MLSHTRWRLPWSLGMALLLGLAASDSQAQSPGIPPGYGMGPPGYGAPAGYGMAPNYGPAAAGPAGYGPAGYGPAGYGPAGYGPAGAGPAGSPTAYYLPDGTMLQVAGEEAPGAAGGMPPGPMPMAGGEEMAGEYADVGGEWFGEDLHHRWPNGTLLGLLLPYAEGGICTPRWFDVRVSAVNLARDNASRRVDFTARGLAPIDGTPNVVLSSDNLTFDDEFGARVVVQRQLGPGGNIEFNWLGGFNFSSAAQVTDPTQALFSVLSDYGRSPPFGFNETDFATFHNIAYSSAFNSYELMYRRRWQGRNCRLQGSYIAGVRYLQLTEDFAHSTRRPGAPNVAPSVFFMDYTVGTNNSLTGLQIGGDAWISVIPGLSLGGEAKAGVYGNHSNQNTEIRATSIPDGFRETLKSDDVAFIGELNAMAIYRINYHWTFRAGYDVLFMDGLALAIENFNPGQPFVTNPVLAPSRVPSYNDNGQLLLHGWNVGFEYLW